MSGRWCVATAVMAAALIVPQAAAGNGHGKSRESGSADAARAAAAFVPELVVHKSIGREEAMANGIREDDLPADSVLAADAFSEAAVAAAAGGCWQTVWHHQAGLFPYNRHIYQQTTWCGNGSVITSRSTSDWPATGPGCGANWGPSSWRAGGGVGQTSVDVTTRGGFSCFVAPLGNLQFWLWMTPRYYPWGATAMAGYGY